MATLPTTTNTSHTQHWARISRRAGFVPLTLIILLSSANATFAASCGHYLFRNGKPVETTQGHDQVRVAFSHVAGIPGLETPHPKQAPCKGPGCRKSSIPLLPSSAPLSTTTASELAILLQELIFKSPAFGRFSHPCSERGSFHQPSELFRPPATV